MLAQNIDFSYRLVIIKHTTHSETCFRHVNDAVSWVRHGFSRSIKEIFIGKLYTTRGGMFFGVVFFILLGSSGTVRC